MLFIRLYERQLRNYMASTTKQSNLSATRSLSDLDSKLQYECLPESPGSGCDEEHDALLDDTHETESLLDYSEKSPRPSSDVEEFTVQNNCNGRHCQRHQNRHFPRFKAFLIVFSGACWLFLLLLHFLQPAYREKLEKSANLDTSHRATNDFDLVISMYREDATSVAMIVEQILATLPSSATYRVIIYTKDEAWEEPKLRAEFPNAEIVPRPNIGREGETYLYHILSRWDDLATHTLFTQALPDHFDEFLFRIKEHFVPETGMMGLSFVSEICDCHLCSGPYWHDYSGVLAKTYELANKAPCDWLLLSFKGQFIASAARIRGAGREVYEYLETALADPNSWAHQPEYWAQLDQGVDSMNAPILGFSVERLWFAIMQCSNLEVPAHCHTMISNNTKRGLAADDCQCYDYEPGTNYIGS